MTPTQAYEQLYILYDLPSFDAFYWEPEVGEVVTAITEPFVAYSRTLEHIAAEIVALVERADPSLVRPGMTPTQAYAELDRLVDLLAWFNVPWVELNPDWREYDTH